MAILNRIRLCIWAWRIPAAGINEMLTFAADVEDFYRILDITTPEKPIVTTHDIVSVTEQIRDFPPIELDEIEEGHDG